MKKPNSMQNPEINYNDWMFNFDKADFGNMAVGYGMGWYDEGVEGETLPYKERTGNLYPCLACFYVTHTPKAPIDRSANKLSEETKALFSKFYQKDLETIILNFSILAKPGYYGIVDPNFSYSTSNYCFIPKNPINYPANYEFLLSDFWIKNKIYRQSKWGRGKDGPIRYAPFESQWEFIFSCIWKNYVQLENRTLMSQYQFMRYLEAIAELAKDTLAYPLNNMSDKDFNKRIEYIASTIESPDEHGYSYSGLKCTRWHNKTITDKIKAFDMRLLDANGYLNAFFKQYNYNTMKNALELFLIKMFESVADGLVAKRLLTKCSFCGEYFIYSKGKKFCSVKAEGRDCGKSARNKRYYATTGQKRLPKYRKTTKELRAFYKEKGVKK